jgi:mono/diheme cytochrome c family protein
MQKITVKFLWTSLLILLVGSIGGGCQCSKNSDTPRSVTTDSDQAASGEAAKAASQAKSPEQLYARGRAVYNSACIACHSSNPKLQGSQGPDVWGASKELLTLRVLKGVYPEGYTPKRKSGVMPMFPHLESDIDALTEFLNTTK